MQNPEEKFISAWNFLNPQLPSPLNAEELERLLIAHQEKQRAYHTLTHIADLLTKIEEWKDEFEESVNAKWVALYHDAVYQPGRKDNETKSAEWAVQSLSQAGIAADSLQWIDDTIRRTANHDGSGANRDALLFLDLDLSILGAEPARYESYCREIRFEYKRIPWFLYKGGRKKVLKNFLKRDTIYFTELAREKWEENARQNMENELKTI